MKLSAECGGDKRASEPLDPAAWRTRLGKCACTCAILHCAELLAGTVYCAVMLLSRSQKRLLGYASEMQVKKGE